MLPCPDSEVAADLIWTKAKRHLNGSNRGIFFRLSEALIDDPAATKATVRGGRLHGIDDIRSELEVTYSGFHQYDWVRPRKTWLDAQAPVYIDFGNEYLVKLCIYDASGLLCIRLIDKRKFVHDSMHEQQAEKIATRFYPINGVDP